MRVRNSTLDEEAVYKCEIDLLETNRKTQETSILIIIKPEFVSVTSLRDSIRENNTIFVETVFCEVKSGKPKATVKWVGKDGYNLPESIYKQTIRNRKTSLVNTLSILPNRNMNKVEVFCKIEHFLLEKIVMEQPKIFNITCKFKKNLKIKFFILSEKKIKTYFDENV